MREKNIENQIKRYLDRLGCWYMKVHGSAFQKAGVPDLIACIGGRFVGIEVKRPGGRVSPLQKLNIEEIQRSGGVAFVAYSVEDVQREIEKLRNAL
jgi:VRR-NUC domain.